MTKKINLKLVGAAILPALATSITIVLVAQAVGIPESTADRVSQIVFFPVFLGACHAWRQHFDSVS